MEKIEEAPILIVDEDEETVGVLETALAEDGFTTVESTTDAGETLTLCRKFGPELLLLDLGLSDPDSFEILESLQDKKADFTSPSVVCMANGKADGDRRKALSLEARDLLAKPLDALEVSLRVRSRLELRSLTRQVREHADRLAERGRERNEELESAQIGVLHVLARLVEYRDFRAERHSGRVGDLSARIARQLGLPEEEVDRIRVAAPLHDVGMIVVPDRILLKSSGLDEQERRIMMTHAANGAQILSESDLPALKLAREIALTHHERWNGEGYPRGLERDEIPLAGRIVAAADAFEAITHERPFREAESVEGALEEIERQRGKQFDPEVADALVEVVNEESYSPV